MNYRLLALTIGALSSTQITTAAAQPVYIAPGGVYIGGGPVYVIPAPSNGPYVESFYGYGVPEPYLAPPVVAPPVVAPGAGYVAAGFYGLNGYGYGYGNGYGYYGNGYGYGYGNGNGYGYGSGYGYGNGYRYGPPAPAYYNGGPVLQAYGRARLSHPARRPR